MGRLARRARHIRGVRRARHVHRVRRVRHGRLLLLQFDEVQSRGLFSTEVAFALHHTQLPLVRF